MPLSEASETYIHASRPHVNQLPRGKAYTGPFHIAYITTEKDKTLANPEKLGLEVYVAPFDGSLASAVVSETCDAAFASAPPVTFAIGCVVRTCFLSCRHGIGSEKERRRHCFLSANHFWTSVPRVSGLKAARHIQPPTPFKYKIQKHACCSHHDTGMWKIDTLTDEVIERDSFQVGRY